MKWTKNYFNDFKPMTWITFSFFISFFYDTLSACSHWYTCKSIPTEVFGNKRKYHRATTDVAFCSLVYSSHVCRDGSRCQRLLKSYVTYMHLVWQGASYPSQPKPAAFIGVKLGLSHEGENIIWGCFKIRGPGKKICATNRDEVTGRRNEELHNSYFSKDVTGKHCSR